MLFGSLHAEIGRTWSDINRYDQSLAGYNRALSYAPGNQSYIYEIARLYDRLGKMRNSAAHYRSAIKYFEEYITIEQAILDRVIKERGLDPDQVSSQGLNYARQRIKEINNELFFMGEKH